MDWKYRDEYLRSPRNIWQTERDSGSLALSGWVQTYDKLTEIVINGAGHLAPMNQPESLFGMITRFVNNQPFLIKSL